MPAEQEEPDVGTVAKASHHGENRMYPLSARDRVEIAENIRNVPSVARPRAYLASVFCAVPARLAPEHPDDPRAFHMPKFF